jgi:hypothetical protein
MLENKEWNVLRSENEKMVMNEKMLKVNVSVWMVGKEKNDKLNEMLVNKEWNEVRIESVWMVESVVEKMVCEDVRKDG